MQAEVSILAALTASGKAFCAQWPSGWPTVFGKTKQLLSSERSRLERIDRTSDVMGTWRVFPFFDRGIVIDRILEVDVPPALPRNSVLPKTRLKKNRQTLLVLFCSKNSAQ